MPFPYDKYPWLNFHELNLAYFIKHFREIFQQWDTLLNDMYAWKDATDAELAEWKTAVEAGITSWETGLLQSMEDWKNQTETDISTWEAATLAALDAWKTATTAAFEQIRTEAAASAQAAAGSATAAQTALAGAQAAQAAAEAAAAGIQSELTQIQQNTADIADLQESVSNISPYVRTQDYRWQDGYRIATNVAVIDTDAVYPAPAYACLIMEVLQGQKFHITASQTTNVYNAWCWADAQKNKISSSPQGIHEDEEIIAPADGYLICCTNNQAYKSLTSPDSMPELLGNVSQLLTNVDELQTMSQEIETLMFPESFFEQGTFGSNGSQVEATTAIRLNRKITTTRNAHLIPRSGYRVLAVIYNDSGVYESQTTWGTTPITIPAGKQYRYAISHTKPTATTDLTDYNKVLAINSSYDSWLSHERLNSAIQESWKTRENMLRNMANMFSNESNNAGRAYYVGAGNTYATITDAVNAWATDNYPDATIYISNGEYKESITVEGHNINFIGESRDGTIIHTTSGDYTDPPLNIRHGTVKVKNMTLISDHTENPNFDYEAAPTLKAYGIHIDGGEVGGIVTLENCTIMSFQAPAIGSGTIPNSKIRVINCDCYSFTALTLDTSTAQYARLMQGCILWHTSNPSVYPTRGSEEYELINVRAYMANSYVVLKTNRSDPGDNMDILAINNLLLTNYNPNSQSPVSGPVTPAADSIGNNVNSLNYSGV